MPIHGSHFWSRLGAPPDYMALLASGGATTSAMPTLNNGGAFRFQASSTKDIKSVILHWSTVTTPGTVRVQIEPIDATTGKPAAAGTPYDVNATKDVTPTAGFQTITFATLPTTGLVVGNWYAVVIYTTVTGTAHTLSATNSMNVVAHYGTILLTAADVSTRSNLAEVASSVPLCAFIMEDDTVETDSFFPFAGAVTTSNVYGANLVAGTAMILGSTVKVAGVYGSVSKILGTPGDLRCSIYDSGGILVTGAQVTVDRDMLVTGSTGRSHWFLFPSIITLSSGTYRIVFDSATSDASNYWGVKAYTVFHSDLLVNYKHCSSSTGVANLVDSSTLMGNAGFLIDDLVGGSAGSGNSMIL